MSKFFTFLLSLSTVLSFSQATHFKSVRIETINEFGKTYYEVIAVTFYRDRDVGFDLYTHRGTLVGKVSIKAVLPSSIPLDEKIMATISSDLYRRERERYGSQESQKFVAAVLLLSAKIAFLHY